jgi:ABC-type transport system substrate-binding protein
MARSLSRRDFLGSVLATAGVSGMLLSGCGGNGREKQAEGTPSGVPKRGGTIRSATPALLGLDPMTTEGVQLAPNFYSSVVQMTDWRGTVGDLALSWEVVDDLDWIFRLRPDARFHDVPPVNGRPLVASDIPKSIDRAKSMPGASESWKQWVDNYEAPDDTTFRLHTKNPYGYLLGLITICSIIPIEAVEEFGDLKNHAIGSGPFVLTQYSRDEMVDRIRNPQYYHEYPYVDGLSTRVLPDEASIQAAFRAGAVDVYNASNKLKADSVKNVGGASIYRYLNRRYACIRLNGSRLAAFKDERVREAIDLALDRKAMIDKLHFGDAELAGPVPPVFETSLPKEELEAAYARDVPKAKQLLSAAGQERLRFGMSIGTYEDMPDQAAIIKDDLAEAGITVDIEASELGSWLSNMLLGHFDATVFTHLAYMTDEIPLQSHHSHGDTRNERNYLGVDDAEVDAILDRIQQTLDENERKGLAWEAQRLVLKRHGPTLLLYQPYGYWCAYDYIKGYTPTAYGFGLFKFDYWIDKG